MPFRKSTTPRMVTTLLLIIVIIGLTIALLAGWRHGDRFQMSENAHATVIFSIQRITALFGLVPIIVFWARLRKERKDFLSRIRTWLPIRLAVYAGFAAIASNSLAYGYGLVGDSGFLMRAFFYSSYAFWAAVWALMVTGFPSLFLETRRGALHVVDVALANAVVVLVLLEGGLKLAASHSHSPLFWDASSIESTLNKYRQKPHFEYFGFAFNEQGYHDEAFFTGGENDFVVALLADSFGMGVVPYDFNFATVAERDLQTKLAGTYQRIAIHNFGIPCIGIQEYAHLLTTEVLKWRPDLVLICIFLGNDIDSHTDSEVGRRCFQGWFVWIVANRVWTMLHEEVVGPEAMPKEGGGGETTRVQVPRYIFDSSLEAPTFSREAFLRIEQTRLEICNAQDPSIEKKFQWFFQVLTHIKNLLRERLALVLIPDQFQVDDALYHQILSTKDRPDAYVRDYPQQRIKDYCLTHAIPLLDLTGPLKSAEQKGRTYHLQDTHWNAYGNRVAGEAIASFVVMQWKNMDPPANGPMPVKKD